MTENGTSEGNSLCSSSFSANSDASHKNNAHFYTEKFPLFPVFCRLRADWNPKASVLAIAFQGLQLLAFVVNTLEDWGSVMALIRKAVFFSLFPIWEPTFISENRKVPSLVFFWAFFAALATACCVLLGLLRDSGENQVPASLVTFTKQMVHATGSVAFFPATNMILSFMVCDDGKVRSFDDETCWGAWHSLHFFAGVLALVIVYLFTYTGTVILHRMGPTEQFLSASRSNSQFDEVFMYQRFLVVVAFHLLSKSSLPVFYVVLAVTMLTAIVVLSMQLPYYSKVVTKVQVGVFCVVLWAAVLGIVKDQAGAAFTEDNVACAAFFAGSLVAFGLGYAKADFRTSSRLRMQFDLLNRGEIDQLVALNQASKFPKNLPEADLRVTRVLSIIESMAPYCVAEGQTEFLSEVCSAKDEFEVVGNYINTVVLPTDVEVSSRFLREYILQYSKPCSMSMLYFAARIYSKGLVKYTGNYLVHLHFVCFLAYYAGCIQVPGVEPVVVRVRAALAQVEQLMGMEASIVVLYQAHLLQVMMKPIIGMTNDSHRKVVASAVRTYKEILGQMAMFWNKLLISESGDTLQLAGIANSVTNRRGQGLELFRKALVHPTYNLARKYAQFLRQVMLDEDAAHTLEQRLQYMQREQKQKQAVGVSATDLGEVASEIASKKLVHSSGLHERSRSSSTIRQLSKTINVMFALMILILASFFAFESALHSSRMHYIDQVERAGQTRSLAAQAAVLVQQIGWYAKQTSLTAEELTIAGGLQRQLLETASEFMLHHYALSHGDLSTSYGPHQDLYKEDQCEHIEIQRGGDTIRTAVPLWTLGNTYGNTLLSVAAGSLSSSAAASEQIRLADIEYVRQNVLATVGPVLNKSVELYEDGHLASEESFAWTVAALFFMTVLLIFLVYLTMVINFQKVGASKLATLNLFTYIPHVHLKSLAKEATQRVATCEAEEREDELEITFNNGSEVSREKSKASADGGTDGTGNGHRNSLQQGDDGNATQPDNDLADPSSVVVGGAEHSEERSEANQHSTRLVPSNAGDKNKLWARLTTAVIGVVVCLVFMLSVLSAVFGVVMIQSVDDAKQGYESNAAEDTALLKYHRTIESLSRHAEALTQNAEDAHLLLYWEMAYSQELENIHADLVLNLKDKARLPAFLSAMQSVDTLVQAQLVSQALALNTTGQTTETEAPLSYHTVSDLRKLASHLKWNLTAESDAELLVYKGRRISVPPLLLTTSSKDLSATLEQKRLLSRIAVFQDKYKVDLNIALENLALSSSLASIDYNTALIVGLIAVLFAQLVANGGLWVCSVYHESLRKFGSFRVLLQAHTAATLAAAVLTGMLLHQAQSATEVSKEFSRASRLVNRTETAVRHPGDLMRNFAQFGDPDYYDAHSQYLAEGVLEKLLDDDLLFETVVADYSVYSDAFRELYKLRTSERIAAARASVAFGLAEDTLDGLNQARFGWVQSFTYNLTQQGELYSDIFKVQQHHPLAGQVYQDARSDAEKSEELQEKIARYAVGSSAYRAFVDDAIEKFATAAKLVKQEKKSDIDSKHALIKSFAQIVVIVELAVLSVCFVYAALIVVQFLNMLSGSDNHADFFPILMRRCRLSLALLTALVVVAYIFTFVNRASTDGIVQNSNSASTREWLVAQSMVLVQDVLSPNLAPHERYKLLGQLQVTSNRILENRFDFSSLAGSSADLDQASYGTPHSPDPYYSVNNARDTTQRVVGTCRAPPASAQPGPAMLESRQGIELALYNWVNLLDEVLRLDPIHGFEADTSPRFEQLRADAYAFQPVLYKSCVASSLHQIVSSKEAVNTASTLQYTLLGIVVFFTVFGYVFVFRKMVHLLRNEEEGTKLMLTMIPQEVRETVPAIAEYLATGVITLNDKIKESNEWIVEYSGVSTVIIDHMGTITRFSRAAREAFGYELDEVMGKNVKMLMPDEYATHHDGYLATFRKTGEKHIIGQTRVAKALQKNGGTFDASVTVREVKRTGHDPVFIGNILDITSDVALERELKIGISVVKLSNTPIIITDTTGTALDVSLSAASMFNIKAGHDIKKLMSAEIAEEHDEYLRRYLRTREARIVGKSGRKLQVKTSSNTEVHGELQVQVFSDAQGEIAGFIGYLRDLTDDDKKKYARAVSESVMRVNPNPMISITQLGIINRWNSQSEIAFGYTASEILGQNIKIIVPDDIAPSHDGYLAKYLKTGEKKMINQTRSVQAKKKDGTYFSGEVSIREVGKSYIGYLRETTSEDELKATLDLQQTIMERTTSCIVMINKSGPSFLLF
ncbi:Sensor protein FixL [Diplonema papillatum]|nr:Sensor protein FixL [Diplonema papillatum]